LLNKTTCFPRINPRIFAEFKPVKDVIWGGVGNDGDSFFPAKKMDSLRVMDKLA